ncbi:MAG TPA: hypothetical protein P5137_05270 [Candidatus Brocadiia bacterium]|nr:hypothetical protein [Candidatus Brocadiia bacterium]
MTATTNVCRCNHCKKDVTFHVNPVNHLQQLLMTIFTLGLWLPMWIVSAVARPKICDACQKPIYE